MPQTTGGGTVCGPQSTGGLWTSDEKPHHINYLELLAVFVGLKALCNSHRNGHIRLKIDNTTAVAVINHMGRSHSGHLNELCKEIWDWCIARNLWISAGHIAGKANVEADLESRQKQTITEWILNTTLFSQSLKTLQFAPDNDLFASRLNKQLPDYVTYRPDPESIAIDAFTINWAKLKFYAFPPFSVIAAVLKKIQEDKATGVCVLPNWSSHCLVPQGNENDGTGTSSVGREQNTTPFAQPTNRTPSAPQKNTDPACLPLIRTHLNNKEISTTAKDIIMASWRASTAKQYQIHLSRWEMFCKSRNINTSDASNENGIDFLASLYEKGLGHNAINTVRSALSSVLDLPGGNTFGTYPRVTRFLKGVFELKPSLPRYATIWDVGTVLRYLQTLPPIPELNLKTLTKKLTMLLCLLTGQRCQTLTKLDISFMQALPDKYVFTIGEKRKTTKPGKHLEPVELVAYKQHIIHYLHMTKALRGLNCQLLISFIKPHNPVSNSTIGKWVKFFLDDAGIDVMKFSGNSARPGATSYGTLTGLTLQDILKAGGWSNAQTFATYYNKPIATNFGTSILEHFRGTQNS